MPRIPSSKRQIREQGFVAPRSNIRAPQLGTTGQAVPALAQTAGIIAQGLDRETKRAEDVEFARYKTDLRNELVRSMEDPEAGFRRRKGLDTVNGADVYTADYDTFLETRTAELGSESLRNRASGEVDKFRGDYRRQIDSHTVREMDAYDDRQLPANLQSIQDRASVDYKEFGTNDSVVNESLVEQNDLLNAYAERKGLSAQETKNLKLNASSKLHERVTMQALNNNEDLLAKDYYEQAKERGELNGDTVTRLDKIINRANTKGVSQRVAADVMSRGLNYSEGLALAREKGGDISPDVQDEAVRRYKNRWSEVQLGKKYTNQASFDQLGALVRETGNVPLGVAGTLSPKQKGIVDKMAKLKAQGVDVETNPLVESDLIHMASNPVTRKKFITKDLSLLMGELSEEDYTKFSNQQAKLRENSNSLDSEYGRVFSNTKVIDNVMKELKITGDQNKALFSNSVMKQAAQWQMDNQNKHIGNQELEMIAKNLGREVEVEGTIWNSDKKVYKLEEDDVVILDESGQKFIQSPKSQKVATPTTERTEPDEIGNPVTDAYDSIPQSIREKIINARTKANQPNTKEGVVSAYRIFLKGRNGS